MNDSSIAIIGGADGPTAIYVAGASPFLYIALGIAAISLVVIVSVIIKRKKNK